MSDLSKGAIHIAEWEATPWHKYNIQTHLSYNPVLRETTLTLYTKDHKKVVKITDKEHAELENNYSRNNWSMDHKRKWQCELKTLYQNMGD